MPIYWPGTLKLLETTMPPADPATVELTISNWDCGTAVPIPILPLAKTVIKVEVEVPSVVEAMVKRGVLAAVPTELERERREYGDVVPMPRRLLLSSQKKFELSCASRLPFEKITDPLVNEVAPVPPKFTPRVVEAETAPVMFVVRIPEGEPETVRFVVEAVAKYPVPETESAVEEAKLAVSLMPLKFKEELSSVNRVPSKYGMELVCQVVVPVPPTLATSVELETSDVPLNQIGCPFVKLLAFVPPLAIASVPERFPSERQFPDIEKQPPESWMPFANVDEAEVEVMFRAPLAETPPENVDVPVPWTTR